MIKSPLKESAFRIVQVLLPARSDKEKFLSLPSCAVNIAQCKDRKCVLTQGKHLPFPSKAWIAEVIFQTGCTWALASSDFVRGAGVVAWARWPIGEAVRTLGYNNKHVCPWNLDYCVRITGRLSGFLTSIYFFVHYDLRAKQIEKKTSKRPVQLLKAILLETAENKQPACKNLH